MFHKQIYFRVLFAILVASTTFSSSHVFAQGTAKRIAVVIGNDQYGQTGQSRNDPWGPLDNAAKDAADIGKRLQELGFSVEVLENQSRRQMFDALGRLKKLAKGADQVIVYYAGHAVQIGSTNYLIPVDSGPSTSEAALESDAIPFERVLQAVSGGTGTNIVILDACRTLPRGFRGSEVGLAAVKTETLPPETLVIFSTQANQLAADGLGQKNGFFAQGLLRGLTLSDKSLRSVMLETERAVLRQSGNRQRPVIYGSFLAQENFRFSSEQNNQQANTMPQLISYSGGTTVQNSAETRQATSEQEKILACDSPECKVVPTAEKNAHRVQQITTCVASNGKEFAALEGVCTFPPTKVHLSMVVTANAYDADVPFGNTMVASNISNIQGKDYISNPKSNDDIKGQVTCKVVDISGNTIANFLDKTQNPLGIEVRQGSACKAQRNAYIRLHNLQPL